MGKVEPQLVALPFMLPCLQPLRPLRHSGGWTEAGKIYLVHLLMIMGLRILENIDEVYRGNAVRIITKGAPGITAWTSHGFNLIKLSDQIVLLRSFHDLQSLLDYFTPRQAFNTIPSAVNTKLYLQ